MRRIEFDKYHGTGNDFIIIDDREELFDIHDSNLVSSLCRRRFGIGADGLILIRYHQDSDFEMVYFNADGQLGSMCGNGGRCAVAYAHKRGITGSTARFMAHDGIHEAKVIDESTIKLKMSPVDKVEMVGMHYVLDTGSPHYVIFDEMIDSLDVAELGREVRNSPPYAAAGINVNFVEPREDGIAVRTYERGVESETYSCGTGVVASALTAAIKQDLEGTGIVIDVYTTGGQLKVYFDYKNGQFQDVFLQGPVKYVFSGSVDS